MRSLHPGISVEPNGDGIAMGYTYLITATGNEKINKVNIFD